VASLEADGPGEISFLANPRYAARVKQSRAGALIAREPVSGFSGSLLLNQDPYLAFARVLRIFHPPQRPEPGIHAPLPAGVRVGAEVYLGPQVTVGENVRIGPRCIIHPGTVLYPGVVLGADCEIHGGVVIREDCLLGDGVILQPGVVVGSDGFGFAPGPRGLEKIPQTGRVRIGDLVEVGAGTTIDRATLGETVLEQGVKLDNLVQVGHNVRIGAWTVIAAQTGISGSTTIGSRCRIGGQVGIAGHLRIGDGVTIGAQSGVVSDLPDGSTVSGYPAREHHQALRIQAQIQHLPQLRRRVRELEKLLQKGNT